MAMEEALVAWLVSAGTLAEDRVSWFQRVRGDAVPAITLSKISPGRDYTHDGPDELDLPRVQFDAWAETDELAVALARQIRPLIEGGGISEGNLFHPGELVGELWAAEGEQDGGAQLYRAMQDFQFYHEEL